MPQADGTILIDTEINADGMKAGSKEVEAAVRRMAASVNDLGTKAKTALNKQVDSFAKLNKEYAAQAQKVEELKKKVAEYGSQKIPTEEYSKLQQELSEIESQYAKLNNQKKEWESLGIGDDSLAYKSLSDELGEVSIKAENARTKMKQLEASGNAFTVGAQTKQAAADMENLAAAERKLADLNNRLGTSYSSIKGQVNDYNNALLKSSSAQQKASASGNKLSKSLKDTGKSANSARFGIGKMLATSVLFSAVFQAMSAVTGAIKEGFTNLAQYSGTTNNSISMLMSSLSRLKNSLATAFAPILNTIAPILSKFIDMLSTAASYVSMFFAFLSGQSTYTRAVAVQQDYAASLGDTASAAQDAADATDEAAEAAERYLSPLDDINKFTPADTGGGGNEGSGGGGSGGGSGSGPLFEEVEITDIPILEKVKDILSQLFQPFKEAWEKEGQATIDAAKYALSSLGELAKSVGKSFLEVWTNGTGTQTLEYILQIAQNILITIGNIASRLNEAWNTNNIGTQIIQNIFNLLNSVLGTIERITGATADWAATLDFTPLLTSINNLLLALQPLTDNIGAGLEWFWNNVLLPISGWTIQEAVPAFLNMLSAGISALNEVIEALKPLGTWLWDNFLQPLGAWTANATILALQTITNLLTRFSEWASSNQQVVIGITNAVASFFAAWKIIELMSFVQQAGGVIAALNLIKEAVLGNVIAKIADKAETIALTALYAKDFLVGIAQTTAALVKQAAQFAINTAAKIADTAAQVAMTAATTAWNAVCVIATAATTAFGAAVAFLTSPIGIAIVAIGAIIAAGVLLYKNWDKIKEAASSLGEWLGEKWDWIKEKTSEIWNSIKEFIRNVWNNIKTTVSNAIDNVKNVISTAWNAIKTVTSTVWNAIKSFVSGLWNGIKSTASTVFNAIKSAISTVWNGIKSVTSSVWNGIKSTVSSIWNSIKSAASSAFNSIKSKITNVWNSIKSVTSSIWNGIKNTIKGAINGIISGINGMIRGIVSGINSVIRALNKLHFTIPSWVPGFGGKSFGFNIGTISAPQIPYLASGAVIPPNREFLAVLGDQSSGNNIEAPESLLRRIVREESGSSSGTYQFVAQLNGKTIFKEVINQGQLKRIQTGKNAFELA